MDEKIKDSLMFVVNEIKEICSKRNYFEAAIKCNLLLFDIERMQNDFEEMTSDNSFYDIDREKRKMINILIEKLAGRKTRSF